MPKTWVGRTLLAQHEADLQFAMCTSVKTCTGKNDGSVCLDNVQNILEESFFCLAKQTLLTRKRVDYQQSCEAIAASSSKILLSAAADVEKKPWLSHCDVC